MLKPRSDDDDQREERKDKSTDDPWIWKTADTNWDPIDVSDRQLSKLFEERPTTRNFITYLGEDDLRKEMKVRVNCKFLPIDSKVTFPPNVKKFKKTTMVRYEGRSTWKVVEERVPAYAFAETSSMAGKVEEMCVFLQQPKITKDGTAYFCVRGFDPEFDSCRIGTMNMKQRKIADEGIKELN